MVYDNSAHVGAIQQIPYDFGGLMESPFRAVALISAVSAAIFLFTWSGLSGQAKKTPLYHTILLTPDQLRADYMHTYGYPLPDTPNIDQLASEGTAFTRAYAAAHCCRTGGLAIADGLSTTVTFWV